MEQPSLSEQLLSVIQKKTLRAAISKKYQELDTDALTLSIDMNYNRSNVSRTLNNLNRAGFLIKVHAGRHYIWTKRRSAIFITSAKSRWHWIISSRCAGCF